MEKAAISLRAKEQGRGQRENKGIPSQPPEASDQIRNAAGDKDTKIVFLLCQTGETRW